MSSQQEIGNVAKVTDESREASDRVTPEELKVIAREEVSREHGSFLSAFLEAYCRADKDNTVLLTPAMKMLVEKYDLRGERSLRA